MKAKQKKMLIRIIIASVLLIALALSPVTGYLRLALFLIPYFIVGYDILLKAAKGFTNGRIFDENLLMTVATLITPRPSPSCFFIKSANGSKATRWGKVAKISVS